MRGHEPLLAMRRRGIRPVSVDLRTSAGKPLDWWAWREVQGLPDVVIEPGDVPESLDLRFVVGLQVTVCCDGQAERLKRLVLACEAAGAPRVLGYLHRPGGPDGITCIGEMHTHCGDQSWRA